MQLVVCCFHAHEEEHLKYAYVVAFTDEPWNELNLPITTWYPRGRPSGPSSPGLVVF